MTKEIDRVTKLDAAKRQLRAAIRLFFSQLDRVPVHTLASAAQEILLAIAKKCNPEGALRSYSNPENDWVVPEKRKEYLDMIRAPQNFFKHGARDPESSFDFRPLATEFNVFDCLMLLEAIEGVRSRDFEFTIFEVWFFRKHPGILKEGPFKDLLAAAPPLDLDDLAAHYEAIKIWHVRNRKSGAGQIFD